MNPAKKISFGSCGVIYNLRKVLKRNVLLYNAGETLLVVMFYPNARKINQYFVLGMLNIDIIHNQDYDKLYMDRPRYMRIKTGFAKPIE